ncbi:MAG: STAS domain-containing protein [Candidatus Krumholzibacteria bacterium]|nr:STAS domain-containing protein [Candidatus Krumholzibacteria bacterium]MDH4335725.1 STAS domain-containing protein [Candidatus Krumholzibacteria bacterium]MDH5270070.1 STAS domain-containing protein [Candidatus Krumholzibacteria bacterium]MDH5626749.1 STAS domain-containing protein [Candidatus Krumholzibacteria bacterium]
MIVTREYWGDVAVISIHGKLVGGLENSEKCHDCFGETLRAGTKCIVVALGDAPWANSQGIGMLIGAYTSARNAGADLVLAEVSTRIRDVLDVTKLSLIFRTFDSVAEAVTSLERELPPHNGQSVARAELTPIDSHDTRPANDRDEKLPAPH